MLTDQAVSVFGMVFLSEDAQRPPCFSCRNDNAPIYLYLSSSYRTCLERSRTTCVAVLNPLPMTQVTFSTALEKQWLALPS
ncbi:hypothetical protein TNCV_2696781 [Trichonephila clavipes]|nr:hypothetical protein TNCV_2696781 [Trichonephila clavipes]